MDAENISSADCVLCTCGDDVTVYVLSNVSQPMDFGSVMGYVDLGVDGRIIRKWIFQEVGWEAWTGLIWLWTGTGGGRLWMLQWTYGFHIIGGISCVGEDLLLQDDSASWRYLDGSRTYFISAAEDSKWANAEDDINPLKTKRICFI
jgi:hypothetical protein